MRAPSRWTITTASVAGAFLSVLVLEAVRQAAALRALTDLADTYRGYFEALQALERSRQWMAPLGALAGGLLADWIGGELVLLVVVGLFVPLLFGVIRAPTSMVIVRGAAVLEAAVLPAAFVALSTMTRRRLGLVAGVTFAAWQASELSFVAAFRQPFFTGELWAPVYGLGAALAACAACGALVVWRARATAPTDPGSSGEPYREAPPVQAAPRTSVLAAWGSTVRDARVWWLAVACLAVGALVRWVPAWGNVRLPMPEDVGAWDSIPRLQILASLAFVAVMLPASDLAPRGRPYVLAMVIAVGIALDFWLVEGSPPLGAVLRRVLVSTSLVAILPGAYVAAASIRSAGVGLSCALVTVAATAGAASTRALFADGESMFGVTQSASTWFVAFTAAAIVSLVVMARRPVGSPARTTL